MVRGTVALPRELQIMHFLGTNRSATGPHSYQLQLGGLRLACATVGFGKVLANLGEELRVVLAIFVRSTGHVRREFELLDGLRVLAPLQINKSQGVEDGGIAG